ncbi:VanZ family protein [Candidatus Neomarinimicrobiota bacterium]
MNRNTFQKLLIFYIIAILAVSTIPGGAIPKFNIWSIDKILHIIEYFILAFLMINVLKKPTNISILSIIIFGIAFGGFNEIWQGIVAGRYASIYDAIANGIGMIIGSLISLKYLMFSHD